MKKINCLYASVLFGLAGLLEGCRNTSPDKFGSLLYERTIGPEGNLVQERFVLNGRGKEAQEVYRRFDQIYEKSSKDIYDNNSLILRGSFSKKGPEKI